MNNNIFEIYTEKDKQRFWSYVDIKEPDQCWNWQLTPNRFGYGIFSARNKLHRTQRFIKLIEGVNIRNKVVTTTCRNKLCCNPNHLVVMTQKELMEQMRQNGQLSVGSRNRASRLTETDVIEIRNRYQKGSATDGFKGIGVDYGVTPGCIRDIVIGKTWYHV